MARISPAGNRLAACANTGRGKEVWSGETKSSLHGAIHQREVVVRGPRERGRWWMRLLGADEERRRLCKREHLDLVGCMPIQAMKASGWSIVSGRLQPRPAALGKP